MKKVVVRLILKDMRLSTFLLLIRKKNENRSRMETHERSQRFNDKWNTWITALAVKDQLSDHLKRWDTQGRIVRGADQITPGPYLENEDYIYAVIIIYAADYQEAKEIADSCPIFELDGSVEIRKCI